MPSTAPITAATCNFARSGSVIVTVAPILLCLALHCWRFRIFYFQPNRRAPEAFEVIRQHGGMPSQTVTRQTKLLIVGELGWPLLEDGRPSNELSRATAYGIPVASERRFLEWIGKAVPDRVQKTYSTDQLAALSKLSSDMIHEFAQFGLLDERGGRFGFRDLASARQIARLLGDGVRLTEIIRAVSQIRKWLPEVGLANVRLPTTALKSNSLEDGPTKTVSSCSRSMHLSAVP